MVISIITINPNLELNVVKTQDISFKKKIEEMLTYK